LKNFLIDRILNIHETIISHWIVAKLNYIDEMQFSYKFAVLAQIEIFIFNTNQKRN